MSEYHKIITVWERDPSTKFKTLLEEKWATPEFDYLKEAEWVFTEKVDGTNIRVIWDGERVTFGGKTDAAQLYGPLVVRLQEYFPVEKMVGLKGPCILYGEGYGAKIQKGGGNYIADGVSFTLFDVKAGNTWLERKTVEEIATQLDISIVPVIGISTLYEAILRTQKGFKSQWGDFVAEGMVMRPSVELVTRLGHRVISKIKHKDFQ